MIGLSDTIIAALIAAAATLLVCLITNHAQQKKTEALLAYKLDALTKQVEKHNGLVDRMYRIEETASVYEEKMKVVNHRIKDLEHHTGCPTKNEFHN